MPRVICTLANASTQINGVRFVVHKMGMISEEIEQETANVFLAIEGFLCSDKVKADALAAAASVVTAITLAMNQTNTEPGALEAAGANAAGVDRAAKKSPAKT